MPGITIKSIRKLLNDSIAAQAERNAEFHEEMRMQREEQQKRNEEWEKRHEESKKEWEKRHEESKKEWEESRKEWEESKKEWDRRIRRLDRDMGKLGYAYGDHVEAMFVNLSAKFNDIGFKFPKEVKGSVKFLDENKKVLAEVDHLLENGSIVLPIEVKARLNQEHVDDHIRRLGIISGYNAKANDSRKVLGAVAGGIVPQNVLEYAQKRGLYVLVQNGESVEIADGPKNFEPHEW